MTAVVASIAALAALFGGVLAVLGPVPKGTPHEAGERQVPARHHVRLLGIGLAIFALGGLPWSSPLALAVRATAFITGSCVMLVAVRSAWAPTKSRRE